MTAPPAILVTVPTVKVGGTDMSAAMYDAMFELRVELGLNVPGRATLRFHDDGYQMSGAPPFSLGTAVTISAIAAGASSGDQLMSGEVTGIAVDQGRDSAPEFTVVVHDFGQRLARGTKVTAKNDASYGALLSMMASDMGMSADTSLPSDTWPYVLQVDSNMALLDAISERTGADWWVSDKTIYMYPPALSPRRSTTIAVTLGIELMSFAVRADALHAGETKVDGWDRKQQAAVSATSSTKSTDGLPDLLTPYLTPSDSGGPTLRSAAMAATTVPEAQSLADALQARTIASAVTGAGTILHGTKLLPGVLLQVSDAGPTSGTYPVATVEHVYRDQFQTHFTTGDGRPTSLVDTLIPPTGSDSPLLHYGLVVGQVTNNNDDESSGRVKVRYPGMSDTEESAWARTVSPGGGKSRGLVALPEVGDEVLVGFENGDLRQPVVIGGLFGEKSTIPLWDVGSDGTVLGRRLTSRLGHYIELKDGVEPSQQYVKTALAGEEQTFSFGKDKVEMVIPDGVPLSIKVGSNAAIEIDATGALSIKAVSIKMEAQSTVEISAQASAKLSSEGQLQLQGAVASVKAEGELQLQATGPAMLKGATVMIN